MRLLILALCGLFFLAPSVITDLTAERVGDRIVLEWTASGFDGRAVDGHDVRYAPDVASLNLWGVASGVRLGDCYAPVGGVPGVTQRCVILPDDIDVSSARYFRLVPFVLEGSDARFSSELSNIAPVTARLVGDVTRDGSVDVSDLLLVVSRLGSSDTVTDVNEDGIVDLFDLVLVARDFGRSVEIPDPDPTQPPDPTPPEPSPEDPAPEEPPSVPPSDGDAWYEQHWDFSSTEEMRAGVHRSIVDRGGEIELLANQPGGMTTTGNVVRTIYPTPPNNEAHTGVDLLATRARIDMPREMWVEIYIRFHEDWWSNTDDKFIFLIEDHSQAGGEREQNVWRVTPLNSRWYAGAGATPWGRFINVQDYEGAPTPAEMWNGEWNRLRIHARMSSTPTTEDGAIHVWWNDNLFLEQTDYPTGSAAQAHFGNIAMGRNSGPIGTPIRDWGRVRIWIEDPGWT